MHVSTAQSWYLALSNHQRTQRELNEANTQYTTQKVATDLKGFGRNAESLATYQSSLQQINAYNEVAKSAGERLNSQNMALEHLSSAAENAKTDILNAIASGRADSLMQAIGSDFSTALEGLNYKHQGSYLFAGGNDDTPPVSVRTLSELGPLAAATDAFTNGDVKKSSQIDSHTNIQTGMLASDIGSKLMAAFKDIRDFNASTPFGGALSDTQKAKLQTLANDFSSALSDITDYTALNGTFQNRISNTQDSIKSQTNALTGLISDKTDTDLASAFAKVQQAQQALQASSQILSSLNNVSLLNYLK